MNLFYSRKRLNVFLSAFFIILSVIFFAAPALSLQYPPSIDLSLLSKIIINYNLEYKKKSLSNGSSRGEAGILWISPEIGRSFGLKVMIDRDYLGAMDLLKKRDILFEKAVKSMITKKKEKFAGEHVRMIAEAGLLHNKYTKSAGRKLVIYRSKIDPEKDDRLNKKVCSELLERLLENSLMRASKNLRDALGFFYNRCQDLDEKNGPLSPENVQFVNHVFREFSKKAPDGVIRYFDLDKYNRNRRLKGIEWKCVVGRPGSRLIPHIESVLKNHKKSEYLVDPLVFIALIRGESNFDPNAVSFVGAVGLDQIMPKTARDLGMKNIFMPPYLKRANALMKRERKLRGKALALITDINEENKLRLARMSREFMQESLGCKRKRIKLYDRYKKEVLSKGIDDRLDPRKAIEYGFKYFSQMVEIQKGDITLALASYNAGPHRVRQYAGIPPYNETVNFRNKVLKFYREYMRRLEMCHSKKL